MAKQEEIRQLAQPVGAHPEGIFIGNFYDNYFDYLDFCVREEGENYQVAIPLSQESIELKESLGRSIEHRQKVGYNRDFLESYQPNETFYLSSYHREQMAHFGLCVEQRRMPGTYARQIYHKLLIDLAWNSSRLEGNTYSRHEAQKLLETGEAAQDKKFDETQMILNHKDAIDFLVEQIDDINIDYRTIYNIHYLLSKLLIHDKKCRGSLRKIPVGIGESTYIPHANPHVIEECFHLIIQKAAAICDPFEQSFFLMVHLPYLQPFVDVNKRTSRLAANIPFIKANRAPFVFIDVPEEDYIRGMLAIYELNRIELFRDLFVWSYERSAKSFLAVPGVLKGPDRFYVRYNPLLWKLGNMIVVEKMDQEQAKAFILRYTQEQVPQEDHQRFIDTIHDTLNEATKCNYSQFKVSFTDFAKWEKVWNGESRLFEN